MVKIINTVPKC